MEGSDGLQKAPRWSFLRHRWFLKDTTSNAEALSRCEHPGLTCHAWTWHRSARAGAVWWTAQPLWTCLRSPARARTLTPRPSLPVAPSAPTHQSHWVSAGVPRHPAPQRWRPVTTRPCWSADPPDTLMTATAPLCNQGIHSHFYPASVSFFLMERPTREPCQLPVSAPWPLWWAWWAEGLAGG